jgi:ribosomal protein L31
MYRQNGETDAAVVRFGQFRGQRDEGCVVHSYPLVVVEVSSDSHPFWTGARRTLDVAGRVEKFYHRYGQRPSLSGDRQGHNVSRG